MRFKAATRLNVYQKYSGKCSYCGRTIQLNKFHIDHQDANKKNNHFNNLFPSCSSCNILKGARNIQQFEALILNRFYVLQHKNPLLSINLRYEVEIFHYKTVKNNL